MYNNSFYLFYTQHPCPPIDNRDIWGCIWLQRMGSILCSFISLSVDYGIRNNPYLQHSLWPCRKEQNQLQRSICRTEQGIKWTNHHEEGEIRVQQEDCGKRVSVAEGVSFPDFMECWVMDMAWWPHSLEIDNWMTALRWLKVDEFVFVSGFNGCEWWWTVPSLGWNG